MLDAIGPSLPPEVSQAWARVTILLNCGDVAGAIGTARYASGSCAWSRISTDDPWCFAGPEIFPSDQIPAGWAWFEPATSLEVARVLISSTVVGEFAHTPVLMKFVNRVGRLLREPGFRRYDVEAWRILRPVVPGEFDELPEDPFEDLGWYSL